MILDSVSEFLACAQGRFEANEVKNSLIYGLSLRIRDGNMAMVDKPLFAFNEVGEGSWLAALMTPPYNLLLSGGGLGKLDLLPALAEELSSQKEWSIPGLTCPKELAEIFCRSWCESTAAKAVTTRSERLFELSKVIHCGDARGSFRPAKADELDTLAGWYAAFHSEAVPDEPRGQFEGLVSQDIDRGDIYVWTDQGQPVSMAKKSRPTKQTISINMVYTPPELRSHGFATSCVASLSKQVLEQGYRYAVLFTDLDNPTSNRIYQKIGYRPVEDFVMVSFQ